MCSLTCETNGFFSYLFQSPPHHRTPSKRKGNEQTGGNHNRAHLCENRKEDLTVRPAICDPRDILFNNHSVFPPPVHIIHQAFNTLNTVYSFPQIAPAIREQCEKTQCVEPAKHFQHCAEKVEGGKGWEGEDCVEELFHLMHCVDVSFGGMRLLAICGIVWFGKLGGGVGR